MVDLTTCLLLSLVVLAPAVGATTATAVWAVCRATGQARTAAGPGGRRGWPALSAP